MTADTLQPNRVLGGRYRVVRLIGSGGMGSVYEALQMDLGRRVALKVLDPRLTFEAAHIERFRREAHAAAMLGHANIVQVTDFQTNPNEPPFLVMDFLEGQSLAQLLDRQGQITAQHAARIGVQVLDALAAAHRAGIVHRDIKPDNVFLMQVAAVGEIVKVLDFGVAKLADVPPSSAQLTATGAMLGTPAYMAPEQARGANVDARADLYAVGASLYHALAGTMPFIANSAPALLFAIVEQNPAPLAQLRPDLPRELVYAVERAMAKDVNARFQTADEMRAVLAPIAQVPGQQNSVVVSSAGHAAPSAYAQTIGSNPPGAMTPGPTPQPLAPGVVVPSGIPVVMGQPVPPQPTFGGVAQPTPQPMVPPKQGGGAAAVLRTIFLGLVALTLVGGVIVIGILWMLKGQEATTTTTTPSSSAPAVIASTADTTAPATSAAPSAVLAAGGQQKAQHSPPVTTGNVPNAGGNAATIAAGPALSTTTTIAPVSNGLAPWGRYLTGIPVDLNPSLGPAPKAAAHPYSGARINSSSASSTGSDLGPKQPCSICDFSGFASQITGPAKSLCYAASQFEPPEHEDRGYFFAFDGAGKVTSVMREPVYPSIPRIDACLAKLIYAAKMPLKSPAPGYSEISFTSECDIGWHNHCNAFTAVDGVVKPIQ